MDIEYTVPSTHTPRPQGPTWRGFAETGVMTAVTLFIASWVRSSIFNSDSFFVLWVIHASLYALLNFLYRKILQSI